MSNSIIPGRVISGNIFNRKDYEIAKLKLAIVKRNFRFIDFLESLSKDPHSVIKELRLPNESQDVFMKRLGVLYLQGGPFFGGRAAEFAFFERFITTAQEYWGVSTSEILELLHPGRDLDELSPLTSKGLPLLFYSSGIEEFGLAHGMVLFEKRLGYRRYKPEISGDIERYERILKVDLRKNPAQLLEEFKEILKYEREHLMAGKKFEPLMEQVLTEEFGAEKIRNSGQLFDWDIDDSRNRDEVWEQLKIWDLRRSQETVRSRGGGSVFTIRRTFKRISSELKLTEDLVKKRFYRAYEITQGRKYSIERNRELWEIRKNGLKRECGTCEIRDTCMDPCPDVLRFIEQDHVGPTYTLFSELDQRNLGIRDPDLD
jgi:hypothetical protein